MKSLASVSGGSVGVQWLNPPIQLRASPALLFCLFLVIKKGVFIGMEWG